MKNIQLLDCTLRDGGYVNDWEFGHNNLISMFERSADAGVDIIEVGFLDHRRPFDRNRSIMPDTESVAKIFGETTHRPAMVVGMIDYGTCRIENLQPCSESYLDGIRVIFKEHKMHEAMEYCAQVKKLGYKVFSQLVSITTYTDEKLLELVELVNRVEPYAVSIVDTYGLLYPQDLLHYYQILDDHVKENIQIGFHAHNNLQLAYANSLAFLEKEGKHDIVIDGTLFGMGKSAGNAPLELLAMRMNEKFGKNYRVDALLEGIEESVMDFYKQSSWGYKLFFYLCSKNKCHPNYVTYFKEKQNLSVSKLDELLDRIQPEEKKLLYDKDLAEQLYQEYLADCNWDKDAKEKLEMELQHHELLLVGPGKNICLQKEKVDEFIRKESPVIIAINYIPDEIKVDYVFATNPGRYHDMEIRGQKIIATSNVECRTGENAYIVDRAPLLERHAMIEDNSFLMLLRLLKAVQVKRVVCAGFDGYSEKEDNYFKPAMEYGFVKKEAKRLNEHTRSRIEEFRKSIEISFLTYSTYDEEEDIHSAAF